MKREITIEEKIQELIDGNLSESEAQVILNKIKEDTHLRLLYSTLKEVDSSLHKFELYHPADHFTENVMKGLHQHKPRTFDLRSLYLFLGLVICAAVGLVYASQAELPLPDISPINTKINALPGVEIKVPGIDLPSSDLFLKVFYFGLLFMALIYFDRVILRQLFRS